MKTRTKLHTWSILDGFFFLLNVVEKSVAKGILGGKSWNSNICNRAKIFGRHNALSCTGKKWNRVWNIISCQ
jgi:hypothetical protein